MASLYKEPGAICKGSVAYLSEHEMNLLDRFEGIPEGQDPYGRDFERNRYARVWMDCEVWIAGDASTPKKVKAVAYVRNKDVWEGMPSRRYLEACYKNVSPFWPEVDRFGKLLVFDSKGSLRAEFVGKVPTFDRPQRRERTFLYRLGKMVVQEGKMPTNVSKDNESKTVDGSIDETSASAVVEMSRVLPLYAAVNVYAVDAIDPRTGSFRCKYRIYLWFEFKATKMIPYLDRAQSNGGCAVLSNEELKKVSDVVEIPEVEIYNKCADQIVMDAAVGRVYAPVETGDDDDDDKICSALNRHEGRGWIMWNAMYSVTLTNQFGLHDFPFDTQTLRLGLKLLQTKFAERYRLILCTIAYHKQIFDVPGWNICKPSMHVTSNVHKTAEIVIDRVYQPFLWNVALLLNSLTAISALSYTTETRDNAGRLSINVTLLLAAVAFKQLLSQTLPCVAYLTVLDKWMLGCLVVLFVSSGLSVLPSAFDDDDHAKLVNLVCAALITACSVLFLPFFLAYAWKRASMLAEPLVRSDDRSFYVFDFAQTWFLGNVNGHLSAYSDSRSVNAPVTGESKTTSNAKHTRPLSVAYPP